MFLTFDNDFAFFSFFFFPQATGFKYMPHGYYGDLLNLFNFINDP